MHYTIKNKKVNFPNKNKSKNYIGHFLHRQKKIKIIYPLLKKQSSLSDYLLVCGQ